jgi:histidyl-tRNA synthetase
MEEFLEEVLRRILEKWGYQEIKVPILGNLELWKDNNVVKIISGGEVLALRPEITSLIIEKVNYVNIPLRLYYIGPIFRLEKEKEITERYQIGWELICPYEEWRDMEILAIFFDIFKNLKINSFIIEINNTEIWDEVFKEFNENIVEKIRKFIIKKDFVGLFDYLSLINVDKKIIKDIRSIIFYPKEEINNNKIKDMIENMIEFRKKLTDIEIDIEKIKISPSLLRPFNYYKGLIFQVYLKDLKNSLGGGGSYIQYNKKGDKIFGIGFAFEEEKIKNLFEYIDDRKIFLGDPKNYKNYFKLMKKEREKNNKVVFIPYRENLNIENLKGEIIILE